MVQCVGVFGGGVVLPVFCFGGAFSVAYFVGHFLIYLMLLFLVLHFLVVQFVFALFCCETFCFYYACFHFGALFDALVKICFICFFRFASPRNTIAEVGTKKRHRTK